MASKRCALDVGLLVADLEAALQFYGGLLDLEVHTELTTSLIGQGRMVQLRVGDSLLKLVQLGELPPPAEPGLTGRLGFRYLTVPVTDIAARLRRLQEAGNEVALPLTRLPNGTLIVMVRDPEGNTVELVQEP